MLARRIRALPRMRDSLLLLVPFNRLEAAIAVRMNARDCSAEYLCAKEQGQPTTRNNPRSPETGSIVV